MRLSMMWRNFSRVTSTSSLLGYFFIPYMAKCRHVTNISIFSFVRESIRFGTWNDKPSGEAWVTFTSNDEANSALAAKQHDYIGNRYIDLFLI
jgi:hypothetical protein